jgi:hypothetical protein
MVVCEKYAVIRHLFLKIVRYTSSSKEHYYHQPLQLDIHGCSFHSPRARMSMVMSKKSSSYARTVQKGSTLKHAAGNLVDATAVRETGY